MRKIIVVFILSTVFSAYLTKAQDMKKLELHIHAQVLWPTSNVEEGDSQMGREGLYGLPSFQLLYNINPYINAGLFYNRSVIGEMSIENDWSNIDSESSVYQSYGAMVKLGSNRIRRISVYAILSAFKAEMSDEFNVPDVQDGNFKISSSGFAYGGGMGVSLKATRGFNITLFEVNYNYYPGELDYLNNKPYGGLSAEMGFVILFLRQK